MSRERIRLALPDVGRREADAVAAVLESGMLTQGPVVEAFEHAIATLVGTRFAVATTSATTALHLSLAALDIGEGDEVIVSDFTFPATANVVVQQGARPVLVDIEPHSLNVVPDAIRAAIGPRTRAIMPVHAFGLPAAMAEVMAIADAAGLPVVEDAACALAATHDGVPAGRWGLAGCFSFHPRKAITTGEGGMVVTNDEAFAARLRMLRTHGGRRIAGRYRFEEPGFNYRMSDILAAVGLAQMDRLDEIVEARRARARMYDELLADVPGVTTPDDSPGRVYQSYVVRLADGIDRDAVIRAMDGLDIETTIGTYAVHSEPAMERFGYRPGDLAESFRAYRQTLALPLHLRMGRAEVERVVDALRDAIR